MMTLLSGLAVLAVLAAIVGIARYNEDEALGWKLAVSFVGGALAVAVASKMLNSDKKQNNVVMVEKSPMQVAESMPLLSAVLADISFVPTLREKSPNLQVRNWLSIKTMLFYVKSIARRVDNHNGKCISVIVD
jgi:hypothetical protein